MRDRSRQEEAEYLLLDIPGGVVGRRGREKPGDVCGDGSVVEVLAVEWN